MIDNLDSYLFINFYSNCRDCQLMEPIISKMADKFGDKIAFRNVNLKEYLNYDKIFSIKSTPTYIILDKDDQEIWRHNGVMSEKLMYKNIKESLCA